MMVVTESHESDETIALLVQSGKSELFGVLVHRYEEKIRRYARKFLSDEEDKKDIVQNVFIKAYVNIQSFDVKRKFSSWLYRIAHNELVNHLKKKRNAFLPLFELDTFLPRYGYNHNEVNETIDRKNVSALIDARFDELPAKYKEPIFLYYLEDLSYKEIAEVLSIPISTVGVRIQRGKKIMKTMLQKKEISP